MKIEDIRSGILVTGIDPSGPVTIVSCEPVGADAITVYFKRADGSLAEQMLFRTHESGLSIASVGRPWAFDAPAEDFKLATEAYRIKLAHLFDPMMAVHTSDVEPLPHQISAVYEAMLPRQPLRFVLADDPGAGKTIMAGLLIRELIMRSDAHRILIVSPGSLSGQWQDELWEKFGLKFDIFSKEKQESSASGNYFDEQDQVIARLDQLSRSEELQEKLKATHWDLIVVDEAHKLSANYFGNQVNETLRFKLGKLLGSITRHFLLMTATPHNGKEEDFQLFLSLIDSDRFYGKFREGAHKVDVTDLMRRMVKEELLKFDGTRLFPERKAYTANYLLSEREASLYAHVTDYVRNEMNRADNLDDQRKKGNVGFALTQLQRRLASSPEAIFQSLKRRKKRLEDRLEEMKVVVRGNRLGQTLATYKPVLIDVPENIDESEDALTPEDYENFAEQVVDQATAAETIQELEAEIFTLKSLEHEAAGVVTSGSDKKWEQLSQILQEQPEMRDSQGNRRKIIIFTEYRDTLNYLSAKIGGLLGKPSAVVTIHGGTNRDERRKIQEEFRQNKEVLVLVATDAAGEGVNLQNANLMVNYDLPWNPNRIEQRFGRIHRIGQREVCHLWNLVASETREGDVFRRLFEKIEIEKLALGGRVFDVLGEAFDNQSLKDLLVEAIRYGESAEVKARLHEVIDNTLDSEKLKEIFKRNALVDNHMSLESLYAIKEEMDKAEARKLQPHFIRSFFLEALERLGGEARPRESGRFEIPHVPAVIRERDRTIGETRTPVLRGYHRVCFEKKDVRVDGKPLADLIHPAHPLMGSVLDLMLENQRSRLKQGTVLLDPADDGTEPRLLLLIDHSVREGAGDDAKTVSRRLQFVSVSPSGETHFAGWAPHLDLIPLAADQMAAAASLLDQPWLKSGIETKALAYASSAIVPEHYEEVRTRRLAQTDKIHVAVRERLIKEINYLTHRYIELEAEVRAGRQPRMQPDQLKKRAEELTARLQARERELESMRHLVSATPVIVGGALVLPAGLFAEPGRSPGLFAADAAARARIERIAMEAVFAAEAALGHVTKDVSAEKCGWDITSHAPTAGGRLQDARLIEVKGRAKGATTLTVTRNEIITALNKPDQFLLAIVLVGEDGQPEGPFYLDKPFDTEPGWAVASVNLDLAALLSRAVPNVG